MPSWDILIFLLITAASVIGGIVQGSMDKKKKAAKKAAKLAKAKSSSTQKARLEHRDFRKQMLEPSKSRTPSEVSRGSRVQTVQGAAAAPGQRSTSTAAAASGVQVPRRQAVSRGRPAGAVAKRIEPRKKAPAPVRSKASPSTEVAVQSAPISQSRRAQVTPAKASKVAGHEIRQFLSDRQSLGKAILLMEILGPPRAIREYGADSRL